MGVTRPSPDLLQAITKHALEANMTQQQKTAQQSLGDWAPGVWPFCCIQASVLKISSVCVSVKFWHIMGICRASMVGRCLESVYILVDWFMPGGSAPKVELQFHGVWPSNKFSTIDTKIQRSSERGIMSLCLWMLRSLEPVLQPILRGNAATYVGGIELIKH